MKKSNKIEAMSWMRLALNQSKVQKKDHHMTSSFVSQYVDFQILSPRTIAGFFRSLITTKELNFHPDTPFEDYIGANSVPTFTNEESIILDKAMEACFVYCQQNQLDLYEIAVDVLTEILSPTK